MSKDVYLIFAAARLNAARCYSSKMLIQNDGNTTFKTVAVTNPKPFVFHVELNRPDRYNAINKQMWL